MTMKRLHCILFLICLGMCLSAQTIWAGVAISPAFIETNFVHGRASGQFLITNTGDSTERYRITSTHFTFDTNGSLNTIPPDDNSIVSMIKFNPKEFSLPPKSRRQIRFVIIANGKKAPAGESKEYWGAMELMSLVTNVVKQQDKAGRSMSVKIIPSILVPIFVSTEDVGHDASLSNLKVTSKESGVTVEALVDNNGQGHLLMEGKFQLVDSSEAVIEEGTFGKTYILPGSGRRFSNIIKSDIPKGDYTFKVEYSAPQLENVVSQSIKCTL